MNSQSSSEPDFAILQKDNHESTAIWIKERGEWTDLPKEDFALVKELARYIRVAPHPEKVVDELKAEAIKSWGGPNNNDNQ